MTDAQLASWLARPGLEVFRRRLVAECGADAVIWLDELIANVRATVWQDLSKQKVTDDEQGR